MYKNCASENLNDLLRKINDQSKEGEQHLVLSDEISADKNGDNFTKLPGRCQQTCILDGS